MDIQEETFNIDPKSFRQAIQEAEQQGLRPAVVIPVDLFGLPADIETVTEIAQSHNIKVLVDGAQSFGASCHDQIVGTMGDAITTSFFRQNLLAAMGMVARYSQMIQTWLLASHPFVCMGRVKKNMTMLL